LAWHNLQEQEFIFYLLRHVYAGATAAITEMDGVRVIGQETSNFIQKVPGTWINRCFIYGFHLTSCLDSTLSVFKPGSTSPSAILFDAWVNFVDKSPTADESIGSIRPELAKAGEWESYWQRLLNVRIIFSIQLSSHMHNLSLGCKVRARIPGFPQSYRFCQHGSDPYAVHHFEVGIPVTYSQYALFGTLYATLSLVRYNYASPSQVIAVGLCQDLEVSTVGYGHRQRG
jgi:hypothetical protein